MLKNIFICLISFGMLLLTACIHEDTSDCNQGVRLHFTHMLNNQNKNLFGDVVESVSVFVFDSDNKYLGTYMSEGKLGNSYKMDLELKPGKYNLIVLGGRLEAYQIGEMLNSSTDDFDLSLKKGVTDISKFSFIIKNEFQAGEFMEVNPGLSDLFYGYSDSLNVSFGTYTEATVDLIRDTKKIETRIIGYQYLAASQLRNEISKDMDVHITSMNGRYINDNTIDKHAKHLKYLFGEYMLNNDTLKCSTVMMRLFTENDPSELNIQIPSTNQILYKKNMVAQIMKNPKYRTQKDLDREDLFLFDINITPELDISIKINGWEIIEVIPEKN